MDKLLIIGAFGEGIELLDGQTVKTKILTNELKSQYGRDNINTIDTYGRFNNVMALFRCIIGFFYNENIMMLPAQNALKVLAPWIVFWNFFFHRRLHYVVIGGWLDGYLDKHYFVEKSLHKFCRIYVETSIMKGALQKRGFHNVSVVPNFKNLGIIKEEEFDYYHEPPFPLVTFSRVMQQKGIEDAVNIVTQINNEAGKSIFTLDIYGQLASDEIEWFELMKNKYSISNDSHSVVQYKGCIQFDKSAEVLSRYFALLFPTRFYTEGIPGTIIDAYAAGLPVISSKWESFADVVEDGVTGFGYEFENLDELKEILLAIAASPNIIIKMKKECIKRAEEFLPSMVIPKFDIK